LGIEITSAGAAILSFIIPTHLNQCVLKLNVICVMCVKSPMLIAKHVCVEKKCSPRWSQKAYMWAERKKTLVYKFRNGKTGGL
jgi:hypothetical protein